MCIILFLAHLYKSTLYPTNWQRQRPLQRPALNIYAVEQQKYHHRQRCDKEPVRIARYLDVGMPPSGQQRHHRINQANHQRRP